MGIVYKDGRLNQYAAKLIQRRATSLRGKYGFKKGDVEDIEQELWLHLMMCEDQFNPEKGAESTFIVTAIDHRIASMIEKRKAGKRDYRIKMDSLDEEVSRKGESDVLRHEVVNKNSYFRKAWDSAREEADDQDRKHDVEEAVRALPLELREIALLLREMSVSEVARKTGIPRTTIDYKRGVIRKLFIKKGIRGC